MGREQLRQAHAADKAAGLSDRQIADLHAHFVACAQPLRLPDHHTAHDVPLPLPASTPW